MARTTHTKEKIERTALQLFVEQGVAETTIRDVAQAAGVSQGAMYNHYKSKDELAWSLFESHFAEIGNDLQALADDHQGLPAQVRAMVQYIFARFDEDPLPVTSIFFARHDNLKRLKPETANPYRVFRNVVASAIERGDIPDQDWNVATSLVVGAASQVVEARILNLLKPPLAHFTDDVAAACLRILQYRGPDHA